mgnify:CR=1 FL=1
MKKTNTILSLLLLFIAFGSNAQTIFSEDFNGGNSLSNWTMFNVDARTPNTNVAYVTDAWVIREDFDSTGVMDSAATSTSWYTPAGASDDYMVSPAIALTANNVLEWQAKAQDVNFPDGYELRISTTTPTVAGLLANPALFTIANENGVWTNRSIDLGLAGYANQTVYLAWRNISNDMFLLLVDNIKVYKPASLDVGVSAILSPASRCGLSTTTNVTVEITNFGLTPVSNIPVRYVFNSAPPFVIDTFPGTIAPGGTATHTFTTGTVNVGAPGTYTISAYTALANDGNAGNDGITNQQVVNSQKSFPYTENFDALTSQTSGNFSNGWTGTQDGSFTWFANTGGTTSTATGPSSDHTSGSGTYMYTEASSPSAPGNEISLISPCIDLSSNPTGIAMDFYYHMFGADIQTLFVEVDNNGTWVTVDSIVGQQQSASSDPWLLRSVNLSAYTSLSELRVRFRTVRGASFNGDVAIDDVVFYTPAPNDAELQSVNLPATAQVGSAVTISGTIRNAGSASMTSLQVNWSENGGTANTDNLSLSLLSNATTNFTHTVTLTAANAGSFTDIKVWTSNPNGMTDGNTMNDTIDHQIYVNTGASVQRKAVLEEYTTSVCQFCPDGAVVVEQVLAQNPNVIGIGVHSCFGTDAMTNTEASSICSTLGNNSAPTGMVDRTVYPGESSAAFSRNLWQSRANARAAQGAPVGLTITGSYVPGASTASVTVSSSFVDFPLPGNLSLSLAVLEDSVVGPSGSPNGLGQYPNNGWNQVNAYNTQAGHPYFGAGNPIPNYVHRHVLRDILPSTWGDQTVIPNTIALNTPYSRIFTVSIPTTWDYEQLSVVAMVNYAGSGIENYQILNAEQVKLSQLTTGLSEVSSNVNGIELAPNPTADLSKITFNLVRNANVNLTVMDVTGKVVQENNLGTLTKGRQQAIIDASALENGFYFVNLRVGEELITRKISVMH